jgi:hypothetical protein
VFFNTNAEKFSVESNVEEDERRIEQRLKQIKFGKNTIGYDRYLAAVPKWHYFAIRSNPSIEIDEKDIQNTLELQIPMKKYQREHLMVELKHGDVNCINGMSRIRQMESVQDQQKPNRTKLERKR